MYSKMFKFKTTQFDEVSKNNTIKMLKHYIGENLPRLER